MTVNILWRDKILFFLKTKFPSEEIKSEYNFIFRTKKQLNILSYSSIKNNLTLESKLFCLDYQCFEIEDKSEIEIIKDKTIKDFIKVVAEKPKRKQIIPKIKEFNLKKDELRFKGLKKEKSN